jgi:hypothetical protein
MSELARADVSALGRGVHVPMSRGTPMVGEIPADRMIVNPSLDVPRYGPDGERLQVVIKPRKNKKRAILLEAAENEEAMAADPVLDGDADVLAEDVQLPPEADANQNGDVHDDDGVPSGGDMVIPTTEDEDADELVIPQLFEEEENDQDAQEEDLGHHIDEDGIRKSARLAQRLGRDIKVNKMSMKEATKLYGDKAAEAMCKEFRNMVDLEVFIPIRYEDCTEDQRQRIIHSSAFLTEKTDENGKVIGIKARWVGSGNEMNKGLYESGSSPTISIEGLFILFALCAGGNMESCTSDIGSAYLHSKMEEFVAVWISASIVPYVLMVMPSAATFVDKKGRLLVRLKKALYGCVQSSRLWFLTMDKILMKEYGFIPNAYDPCLYRKCEGGDQIFVGLHVDDLFSCADAPGLCAKFVDYLKSRFKEVK